MITSISNNLVKMVKSLHYKKGREEHNLFLAEGIHLVQEALKGGMEIRFYLWSPKLPTTAEGIALLETLQLQQAVGYEISDTVFKTIAETDNPQGVIAAIPIPAEVPLILSGITLGLIMDGVQDPGNIGTIIRTAWASGIKHLIFTPGTADPFQGKVVRASMGGIFNLIFFRNISPEKIMFLASHEQIQVVAGDVRANEVYFNCNLKVPTLLLIGSEGRGLVPEWENFSIKKVLIPQPGRAESLNVAVSAGILIYEALRQRFNMDTCKSERALI